MTCEAGLHGLTMPGGIRVPAVISLAAHTDISTPEPRPQEPPGRGLNYLSFLDLPSRFIPKNGTECRGIRCQFRCQIGRQ